MKNDDKSGAIIGCLALIVCLPIGALWSGYVLSILWGWFIVPTFEARPLDMLPAIGVAMVVSFLTKQTDTYVDKDKSSSERFIESIAYTFFAPLIALIFGWILHSFM